MRRRKFARPVAEHYKDGCPFVRCRYCKKLEHRIAECPILLELKENTRREATKLRGVIRSNGNTHQVVMQETREGARCTMVSSELVDKPPTKPASTERRLMEKAKPPKLKGSRATS